MVNCARSTGAISDNTRPDEEKEQVWMSQPYALPGTVANTRTFSSIEKPAMSFLAFARAVFHASLKSGITCGSLDTGGGFDGSVRTKMPMCGRIYF